VAIALVRRRQRSRPGRALAGTGNSRPGRWRRLRPSAHRPGQDGALAEIGADMAAPRRMLRLLQGDVGSGKTLVAVLAMLPRGRIGRAGRADGADRIAGPPAPAARWASSASPAGSRSAC
jgi:RecG-like helicase